MVEARGLVDESGPTATAGWIPIGTFDDHGASLHVFGAEDGLEHLRFDCFEQEPHYHYIDQAEVGNTVVRIDELAVGDPIEFTLA